jgi:hypothetical protein
MNVDYTFIEPTYDPVMGIHEWLPISCRLRINLDLLHVNTNGPGVAYSPTSNHFQPFSTREFCLSIKIKS